ncbi:hypothetical protein Zmor_013000 [Zophobas morio]|uniref:Uncharacterized protein n=1 Tax=Zophobas morio TaxID=2755281 RepID=A0AA38ME75_9CUCU|nr:hypothetical protein Zmor_013000 [Zophobas morio]
MVDPDPCIYCCPIPSGVTSLLDQLETTMDVVPHNDSGRQRKHNQFLMLIEPFRGAALRKRLPELPARIYATHASPVVLISVPSIEARFSFCFLENLAKFTTVKRHKQKKLEHTSIRQGNNHESEFAPRVVILFPFNSPLINKLSMYR